MRPAYGIARVRVLKESDVGTPTGVACARRRAAFQRKQSTVWSLTMPTDCMSAYIVVGPTKRKPRFFMSLLIATEIGGLRGQRVERSRCRFTIVVPSTNAQR